MMTLDDQLRDALIRAGELEPGTCFHCGGQVDKMWLDIYPNWMMCSKCEAKFYNTGPRRVPPPWELEGICRYCGAIHKCGHNVKFCSDKHRQLFRERVIKDNTPPWITNPPSDIELFLRGESLPDEWGVCCTECGNVCGTNKRLPPGAIKSGDDIICYDCRRVWGESH